MSEQTPTPEWTEEQLKKRRRRAIFMAFALAALAVLFFAVTVAKLGGNVANRAL